MTIDNLDYCGEVPNKSFYDEKKVSESDYDNLLEEFKNTHWILKNELLKYMKNDIIALYEIIDIFSQEVYDLENINITNVSSISSIALKSFLTNYYDKKLKHIHIPRYKNYVDIKNGYYGVIVEVFKGSYGGVGLLQIGCAAHFNIKIKVYHTMVL
jgi:hypothetical protein